MDTTTFDGIARHLSSSITRRRALRGLFAGAVTAVAGGEVLRTEDASARRRRKKGKKNQNQRPQDQQQGQPRTLPPGAFCQTNSQCQTGQGYICEVAVNAGNSDRTCSGATGAVCGAPNGDGDDTAPFCAVGHFCALNSQSNQTGTGVCQAVPEEI